MGRDLTEQEWEEIQDREDEARHQASLDAKAEAIVDNQVEAQYEEELARYCETCLKEHNVKQCQLIGSISSDCIVVCFLGSHITPPAEQVGRFEGEL